MFIGLKVLFFILALSLFAPQVHADPLLMPLQVGEWGQYTITYSSGPSWTGTISVIDKITGILAGGGSETYFLVKQEKWGAPNDDDRFKYLRSTADTVYRYNPKTGEEFAYFQDAAVGTKWNYHWKDATHYVEVIAINLSVDTPFGTFNNVIEQLQYAVPDGSSPPPSQYDCEYQFFAPGFGEIKSIDWRTINTADAPMTRLLTASSVPIPASFVLLGSGLIGLLGFGVRRKMQNPH